VDSEVPTPSPARTPVDPPFLSLVVGEEDAGTRLDVFLSEQFGDRSRTWLKRLVKEGDVRIGGKSAKPATRVEAGTWSRGLSKIFRNSASSNRKMSRSACCMPTTT
jgi:23S rRNA-/tRNA-specific pseudouridylate synthase